MTETPSFFSREARQDFENALKSAFWRSLTSWFLNSPNELLPFDEVRKALPLRGQRYIGHREISIDKIVGSVGRYNDFDRAFLPRQSTTKGRWMSVDIAHLQNIILPPIEVYKIGDVYFVKDGNHRVSVARKRGQLFIDAEVIEIDVPVPLTKEVSIDDLIRLQEKADFYQKTELAELRPAADIDLTLPGGYRLLLEHINTHQWFMGEKQNIAIPYPEAVADWYDTVYLPLVQIIFKDNILKQFPGRTEADLYLWIIEHLWYLREKCGCETPGLEEAVEDFTQTRKGKLIRWFQRIWLSVKGALLSRMNKN